MTTSLPDPARPERRRFSLRSWLPGHGPSLRADVVAGLTAAAVVVPQAMAYAAIAGLPLAAGLYTALVPPCVYAALGTSRPLSVTTTSTLAILTAAALHQAVPGGDAAALTSAAATLAALVGGVLLLAWSLRLGMVASFISEPVLVGFKAGIGVVIVLDQLPKLLGLHLARGSFFHNLTDLAEHLGQINLPTVLLAAVMLALQYGLQRFLPRVPAALAVVVTGIAAAAALGFDRFAIDRVGEVARGLPPFDPPDLALTAQLWPAAVGIALISFVETVAAGRAFLGPGEPRPDPNRELLALASTNLAGSLFRNMPSGGGTSQTAVNRRAGARSQLAGLCSAAVVMAVLLWLAPLVHWMPQATLAAVVVVPCAGMVKVGEFRAIARVRSMEFSWALASAAGVVAFGTLRGIVVAVVLSMLALIHHANRRPVFVLARKPGTDVYRPLSSEHPGDETFPGLLILKTEGIIHFANVQRVMELVWRLVGQYRPQVLLFDCSAIPDFEYTALKMLTEGEQKLREAGVTLWLAALNPEPLQLIQHSPLGATLGRARMYFNVDFAVRSFLARSPAPVPAS